MNQSDTADMVLRARRLMRNGSSMQESAIIIGVRSCDLDRALWQHIATDDDELGPQVRIRPHPMW